MKIQRKPTHPGRIIRNMYIRPLSLTITDLAKSLGVSRKAVSAIVNERKSVTPEMALRLSQAFDTTPDLWLNLQRKHDLWCAMNANNDWRDVRQIYQGAEAGLL